MFICCLQAVYSRSSLWRRHEAAATPGATRPGRGHRPCKRAFLIFPHLDTPMFPGYELSFVLHCDIIDVLGNMSGSEAAAALSSTLSSSYCCCAGASKEVINAIPTVTLPAGGGAPDEDADPRCSICLADYEAGATLRKLPCGHQFHRWGVLTAFREESFSLKLSHLPGLYEASVALMPCGHRFHRFVENLNWSAHYRLHMIEAVS